MHIASSRLLPLSLLTLTVACGGSESSAPVSPTPAPQTADATEPQVGGSTRAVDNRSEREKELERELEAAKDRLADAEARANEAERQLNERPGTPAVRRPVRPRGPDPSAVYSIDITDRPYRGAKNAKVTIVKGFEFACPFCYKSRPTIDQLLADYKGDIKVVYKHFVVHPQVATAPAVAACAANRQGKFWKMATHIWKHGYDEYRAQRKPESMSASNMRSIARRYARLNMKKYDRAIADCEAEVKQDENDLRTIGVTGTPAFFVNGRYIRGAQPLGTFKTLIDEELAKANARIKRGDATRKSYYEKFVYNGGKKSL